MERQLWKLIVGILASLDKPRNRRFFEFDDETIVKVWYWSVIHDRPVSWACRRVNWPLDLRKRLLPSSTTMSRRLRTVTVRALLDALEKRVVVPQQPGMFWMIDGKPLVISGCSKDRQAGYGRAVGGNAKGYKLHTLMNAQGEIAAWRVTPMHQSELVMAQRLIGSATVQGYIVGDAHFDTNPLHAFCAAQGQLQLITPRRFGTHRRLAHTRHSRSRLRSIAMLENPYPFFGHQLLHDRKAIERCFGQLTSWGGGLNGLPPWVRTHRRVHRWVQAKLVLTALRRSIPTTTYVA
jgi:hypothetical protein